MKDKNDSNKIQKDIERLASRLAEKKQQLALQKEKNEKRILRSLLKYVIQDASVREAYIATLNDLDKDEFNLFIQEIEQKKEK